MEKLPKIALKRLRQGTAGTKPEVLPSFSERAGGAEHPDADLLTAFAEHKLTDRERASVISHLANCETCREIVALACPPLAEENPPLNVVGRRPAWFTIPIIRWGAISAALGAILITVIVERRVIRPVHETMRAERKQPPAPAPAPSALQANPEAEGKTAIGTRGGSLRQRAAVKSEGRTNAVNPNPPGEKQGGAAGEITRNAEPTVPITAKAAPGNAETPRRYDVEGRVPIAAPVSAAAPGAEPSGAPAILAQPEMARAQSQPVEVAKDKSDAAAALRKEATLAGVQQAEAGPRAHALLKSGDTLLAPAAKKRAKAVGPSVRWSISDTGKVERSADGGTTWEELHVNDSVVFRVVTVAGSEVWAGGARGALYHSVDGGEHWARVYLSPDRGGPEDTIMGIDFPDPFHGRVTTAADERWITSDGGRHWTRE